MNHDQFLDIILTRRSHTKYSIKDLLLFDPEHNSFKPVDNYADFLNAVINPEDVITNILITNGNLLTNTGKKNYIKFINSNLIDL